MYETDALIVLYNITSCLITDPHTKPHGTSCEFTTPLINKGCEILFIAKIIDFFSQNFYCSNKTFNRGLKT
jgi:hypothetical protein